MKSKNIRYVAGLTLVLGVILFFGGKFKDYLENGELLEKHVVSGKPNVEIHIFGLTDAAFSACLVEGWKQKKIFNFLQCSPANFENTTNSRVRQFDGTTFTKRQRPSFQVLWSKDANRVGIAFQGYFVAAYDRTSGRRIQFDDYHEMTNVRDKDGIYLWHDYKKCDHDIEQFLGNSTSNEASKP